MQQQSQSQVTELQDLLSEGLHQKAIKLSLSLVDGSPALRLVHAILQIKTEDVAGALSTLQFKGALPPDLQAQYDSARLYAHYKQGNYALIITELATQVKKSTDQKVLLAQALCRSEKWTESAEVYTDLLTTASEDYQDVLTNLVSVAITSQLHGIQERVIKVTQDYVKKSKGQVGKELLLNQALLHLAFNDISMAREIINRLINLIKLDTQMNQELECDEDYLMATLMLDYLDITHVHDDTKLYDKMKHYEQLVARQDLPKSVVAVCLNNLSCLQEGFFSNHHDTLKRIDDAVSLMEDKFAPQQIQTLKLNRVLVQFARNRLNEGIKAFKEIEALTSPFIAHLLKLFHNLKTQVSFDATQPLAQLMNTTTKEEDRVFAFLLVVAHYHDAPTKVLQLFEQCLVKHIPKWTTCRPLVLLALATMLKANVRSDPLITQIEQAGLLPDLCQYFLLSGELERALALYDTLEKQKHPLADDIRGRVALKFIDQNEWKKAERFLVEVPYPFKIIEEFAELETLETNIQLTKVQRSKSQDITEKLPKTIRKKKRRSRKPKHLPADAPPPNPERWLPKYERKEYRKRKGAQMKSRTQGSSTNVGNKDTMNVFTQGGASTANVDVSKGKKNRKQRK